ncbi:mitochondrial glycerol dehydrogenase Gld1 [Paraphaeosphaeria sporulosa]|uniref:Aldo/keto reductase n=1 Tax=Paraphaeosphaeria sporulosa TaxID=1460663 RepID=A0A177CCV8_9PLEO|nr:Aldo/keto reductase [Paraphaeosphaeria sporulosa]OAG04608.1 Aldo/keto reductase [Paraphaeosphaeria sporulosa]
MSSGKTVTLNTGHKIPQLGYGTWQAAPGEVGNGVYEALKIGYRHLDLAKIYENQKEVAQGIKRAFKEFNIKREDVFITSKLWNTQHDPKTVEAALDDTLAELELEYLDLYLIHWPVNFGPGKDPHSDLFPATSDPNEVNIDNSIPNSETWKAVHALPKSKARSTGVSNFTAKSLKELVDKTGLVPAVNQIERHPILPSDELIAYAKEKNIHITAYSAFGNNFFDIPLLITRPEIKAIAEKKGATPAQVILAWSQIGGHSVIPKSVTASRIAENFKEIELDEEDVKAIKKFSDEHQGRRRYNVPYTANKPRWSINIFDEPEEQEAPNKYII